MNYTELRLLLENRLKTLHQLATESPTGNESIYIDITNQLSVFIGYDADSMAETFKLVDHDARLRTAYDSLERLISGVKWESNPITTDDNKQPEHKTRNPLTALFNNLWESINGKK